MEVDTIMQEIERLPLSKRFLVMEQTLKSIEKDELQTVVWGDDKSNSLYVVAETSLAKEWLSPEDNCWDDVL